MRTLLAAALVLALAACSGPAKKVKPGPADDDLPQEITCCITPGGEGEAENRVSMPVDRCPEELRHPVEQCNVGPGENEPSM